MNRLLKKKTARGILDSMRSAFWQPVSCCALILAAALGARAQPIPGNETGVQVTNVVQATRLATENPNVSQLIHLRGDVLWANVPDGRFVLRDEFGIKQLQMALYGQPLQAGQRIQLEGAGTITKSGASVQIGSIGPVVDNNGIHSMIEKSGSVYLRAGRQPISVEWFYTALRELPRSSLILRNPTNSDGLENCALEVNYQGPGMGRKKIPDSVLFHSRTNALDGTSFADGLNFLCYEISNQSLPDFSQLTAVKIGTASNFDLSVKSRDTNVGMRFEGFIEIPRDGLYTFYLASADGSRLFVGNQTLLVTVTGSATLSEPRRVTAGQSLRDDEDDQWAEVEGNVAFVSEQKNGFELELDSETGRMRLEIADGTGLSEPLLLNSRIRAVGVCESAYNAEGQKVAHTFLVSGKNEIQIVQPKPALTQKVGALPLLTTASEVHRLKWEEAKRGYPVKVKGVVTCVLPEYQAFTIQDSTRGLYVVDYSESRSVPAKIGELLEVDGSTDPSFFAPIVDANAVNSLGAGRLPRPVHPTWDQLMNGSLDAQYVELNGIITVVNGSAVTLVTGDGRIKIELQVDGMKTEELERYEDAVVRVRGCLFANWDPVTHQVKIGEIRVYGAKISIDHPAPADLFSIPAKTIAELMQFSPQAGVFQRVKVSGQIIHAQPPKYYMMDEQHGLQFVLKKPLPELDVGDRIEVTGFPELSGASPLLHEAVARKTGHAALPKARELTATNLMQEDCDATLVEVDGLLVNINEAPLGTVMEMHNGARTFTVRPNPTSNASLPAVGSRLELVGVYSGQGENRAVGQQITSFELLLNSPEDIRVLMQPPWWTLKRLLIIVGALVCVLAGTILWVTQLRRQVDERTTALTEQIQERQRVEQQRAMEQERTRIARDLHDDLGSNLTEIDLLVTLALRRNALPGEAIEQLSQLRAKSRDIVTALDEIVWAVNPKNDSLKGLIVYLSHFSEEFFRASDIRCRLDIEDNIPSFPLRAEVRHNLFLAFKEALNNAARHSGATEVWVRVGTGNSQVRVVIKDNGKGLNPKMNEAELGNGLQNMRQRLEQIGGRCDVRSEAGGGTVVEFWLNQI